MAKRREVVVIAHAVEAGSPDLMTTLVQNALNAEDHRNHGLEGIYAQPNGDVVIVWRVAT